MRKLFISYRSSDATKVDKIAADLNLLRNNDGISRYHTWQDKHDLPPASPNWWDAIVDAIDDSEMFVFNVSKASLESEVCCAELDYAHKLNLPIIPIVLDGEFLLNEQSGKYDLPKETWDLVPDWLAERQFLFYLSANFFSDFEAAVAVFERRWPRRLTAQRPLNPNNKSVHGSNHAVYDAACDYAERLAFKDAEKHFDALVRRNDADYADVAAQWLEIIRLYNEIIEIDERPNSRFLFKKKWEFYASLFPKDFLDGIFDPKDFNTSHRKTSSVNLLTQVSPLPVSSISTSNKNYKFHIGQNVRHDKFGDGAVVESKFVNGNEEVTVNFKKVGIKQIALISSGLQVLDEANLKFRVGQNVHHYKFGDGVVIERKHNGSDEEVTVSFKTVGIKRLAASYANLKVLD